MLIHDERQIALNDIVEHCRKMADHYQENAKLAGDEALADLFSTISRERRGMVSGLEEQLRQLGWLPAAPDPNGELVEELITRVKVAWSEDQRQELLAEMRQAEDRLAALIEAALQQELPEAPGRFLKKMEEAVAVTRRRLAAV